jgi:hypothetical protein
MFVISQNVYYCQAFLAKSMLVNKARSLTLRGSPKRYFTRVGSDLTCILNPRLEMLAKDKYSSLSQTFINNYPRKFYNTGRLCVFALTNRDSLVKTARLNATLLSCVKTYIFFISLPIMSNNMNLTGKEIRTN